MLRIIIVTLVFSLSQLYAQAFYENAPEFKPTLSLHKENISESISYQLPLLPPPSKLPPLPEKLLLFDELPKEELELRIGLLGDEREELVATSFPSVAKE